MAGLTTKYKSKSKVGFYRPQIETDKVIVGGTDLTITAEEINTLAGAPANVVFTVGAQVSTTINVGMQVNDANGDAVTAPMALHAYFSDSDDGSDLAGTPPDSVADGTDGFAIPLVAASIFTLVTDATGAIDIDVTEDGTDTWYLVVVLPNGSLVVSDAIAFSAG